LNNDHRIAFSLFADVSPMNRPQQRAPFNNQVNFYQQQPQAPFQMFYPGAGWLCIFCPFNFQCYNIHLADELLVIWVIKKLNTLTTAKCLRNWLV